MATNLRFVDNLSFLRAKGDGEVDVDEFAVGTEGGEEFAEVVEGHGGRLPSGSVPVIPRPQAEDL